MAVRLPFQNFDEWVTYVFDRPADEDEAWYWKEDHPFDASGIDEPRAPDRICLEYCTKLFSGPGFLLDRFSLAQIEQALWFIAQPDCSSHMLAIIEQDIPWPERELCIESVFALNEALFAVACDPVCSHEHTPKNPLNLICYMFWDLVPNGVKYIFPRDYSEMTANLPLGEPGPEVPVDPDSLSECADEHRAMLNTMERILTLPSVACREHALHGLGHFHEFYPRKVERIVDAFLARETALPDDLLDYARRARAGEVQ